MQANEKLPSERQLADKYEVSRNTIRAVLLELEAAGLVRRIHGKGTFVNRINLESDLGSSFKFGQQMRSLGKVPTTKVIDFEHKEVNSYFAENLGLQIGDMIYKIERLRLADDEVMMFERTYLPVKYFPNLSQAMLEASSMYGIFQNRFDEKIAYADEYFSAGIIGNCDSKFMNLDEGTPCLNLKRRTYDLENRVIEFTLSVARSDVFAYHVRHQIEK